jgi:ABC-type lipoprotein release transport system permease subunit
MRAADLEVKMKHQDEYQERVLKREALKKQAFNRRQSIVFFLMIGILLGVVLLVYMVKLMI